MGSLPIDIEWETYERRPRRYRSTTDIFIVHGHDENSKLRLANFLYRNGLRPIILHEQANKGRTIIEKFECNASMAGYAFVLLTPDDRGGTTTQQQLYYRARQNVILELGYFLGSLGREKVCCIYKKGVELPSDILGVAYVPYKNDVSECFDDLTRELQSAGYKITPS